MGAKAQDFRTPLKRIRHLGAAGHGVEHFIAQRASGAAMALLAPAFLALFALNARNGAEALAAWLASPVGALLALAFFAVGAFHMRLGVQIVIEDYVQADLPRAVFLFLNTVFAFALWGVTSFAILYLAFGS